MIIKWNEERLLIVPLKATKGSSIRPSLTFLPGCNDVDKKTWDSIKKILRRHLESGRIEVVTVEKETEKGVKKITADLKDLEPKEAQNVIEETNNMDSLDKWQEDEVRSDVRNMIKDRKDTIEDYIDDPSKKKPSKRKGRKKRK